jgi:hypothetical protein
VGAGRAVVHPSIQQLEISFYGYVYDYFGYNDNNCEYKYEDGVTEDFEARNHGKARNNSLENCTEDRGN